MSDRERDQPSTERKAFAWKREFQSRGVPHVHLVDGMPTEIEGRDRER